jgi:hypothetical protein
MNVSRFMHQGAEESQSPSLWNFADDVVIVDEKGTIVVCERTVNRALCGVNWLTAGEHWQSVSGLG